MAETPTRRQRATPAKAVWNDEVEQLYSSWHRRAAAAEYGHRLMSDRMRNRHLMLGIPVVVLTTIAKFHLSKVPPDPAWTDRRVHLPEAGPAEAADVILEPERTES
jgi:hypothetical protein